MKYAENMKSNSLSIPHYLGIYNYNDAVKSAMASHITGVSMFAQPFIQAQIKENIKDPHHWPLWRNSPVTGEFPSQRANNVRMFQFDNVIMSWKISLECCWHLVPGKAQFRWRLMQINDACCKCRCLQRHNTCTHNIHWNRHIYSSHIWYFCCCMALVKVALLRLTRLIHWGLSNMVRVRARVRYFEMHISEEKCYDTIPMIKIQIQFPMKYAPDGLNEDVNIDLVNGLASNMRQAIICHLTSRRRH